MGSRRETSDAPPVERSGDARGAAWMMASVVAAAAMTVGVRFSSEELSASLIVMYRAAGGLLIVFAAVLLVARFRGALHFTDWRGHAARGALIGLSTQGGFYAIGQIEAGVAPTEAIGLPTVLAYFVIGGFERLFFFAKRRSNLLGGFLLLRTKCAFMLRHHEAKHRRREQNDSRHHRDRTDHGRMTPAPHANSL